MLGEGVRAAFEFLGIRHRTVCYVEREAPAAAQLVALMEAGALDQALIWSDLLTFDSAAWRGLVDCVIAGFPCQDLSIAGRRAGLDGKRSGLFFDILDIADGCGARALFLENVAGIASATASVVDAEEGALEERAAARVLGELADRGWDAEWISISASDVGASHGRARWFCLGWRGLGHAESEHGGLRQRLGLGEAPTARAEPGLEGSIPKLGHTGLQHQQLQQWGVWSESASAGIGLANAECQLLERRGESGDLARESSEAKGKGDQRQRCGTTADSGCGPVADTSKPRLPHPEQPGEPGEPGSFGRGAVAQLCGTPLFAPGPLDQRWAGIVANRPDLAPAVEPGVRMLADGMAYLVDESRTHQLRQVGNGVVPLQAAVALVCLVRRASGVIA